MPEKLLGRVACPAALGTHMVSQVLIDMCMALDFRFTFGFGYSYSITRYKYQA